MTNPDSVMGGFGGKVLPLVRHFNGDSIGRRVLGYTPFNHVP